MIYNHHNYAKGGGGGGGGGSMAKWIAQKHSILISLFLVVFYALHLQGNESDLSSLPHLHVMITGSSHRSSLVL